MHDVASTLRRRYIYVMCPLRDKDIYPVGPRYSLLADYLLKLNRAQSATRSWQTLVDLTLFLIQTVQSYRNGILRLTDTPVDLATIFFQVRQLLWFPVWTLLRSCWGVGRWLHDVSRRWHNMQGCLWLDFRICQHYLLTNMCVCISTDCIKSYG